MEVEGQGTYEFDVVNLVSPYTLKMMPLQPMLPMNPALALAGRERSQKVFSGKHVRMLTCTRRPKPQPKQEVTQSFALFPDFFPPRRLEIRDQPLSEEDIIIKKKEAATKYLRKILTGKLRSSFKEMKANAWHYHNQREQAKLKKRL